MVLNSSLASGLGRPELAYSAQSNGPIQTGVPPITSVSAGANAGALTFAASVPLMVLAALVVGVAAFAYWVRPHLA